MTTSTVHAAQAAAQLRQAAREVALLAVRRSRAAAPQAREEEHDGHDARRAEAPISVPPVPVPASGAADRWPRESLQELSACPSAVRSARLHARHVLRDWGLAKLTETTELLVSELVTNAVAISATLTPPAPVQLWLAAGHGSVAVFVHDASPQPPQPANPDADAEHGRGLFLVEVLSTQWGWYYSECTGRKVVWAVISSDTQEATWVPPTC